MNKITLDTARLIVREALNHASKTKMKPLSVAVVDAGGHLIAFERADGAPVGRFELALGKAYGSVMLGIGGTAQRDRAEAQAYFIAAANAAYGGKLVPVPGGFVVRNAAGDVVGGVGVTGDTSENDMAAGDAGITAAGLVAEG
ncbi:heme-binding protein [Aliiroseovarius sp. F47248L]|uniref:GlcG/HbpS family heme-binding protein n=1 Tax=Aliiroseovarius sp. F47248L TaxID=2926420 RepID=UPI001FF4817C|nr:heme-binding protein [Aliiroseovarius sp. F47248L]MCK0138984.1 heme-binding protein [Aliiroseovarius sp. F47248L]